MDVILWIRTEMAFVIMPAVCVFMRMQMGMVSAIIVAVITGAVWPAAAEILWMRTVMVSVIIMESAKEADMVAAVRAGAETTSGVAGADKRNYYAERTGDNQSH
ncbi:MAG: hypothetical protein K2P76_03840 [Lachnospiraceae bacterium]|nr:hypothetical protein [Lachnospiraceae bacterium]